MKLAVLIDADNISAASAKEILAKVAELGEPITKRAFGNITAFSGKEGWKNAVRQFGLDARPQLSNVDRKNTADFAMIINAMDCLASGKYDGFVLVSSDSDFTSLAQRLRDDDKQVFGIGDDRAPVSFRMACTQFINLTAPTVKIPVQPAPHKVEAPVPATPTPASAPTMVPPLVPPVDISKEPTPFQKIVECLQKQKCRKLATLQNSLANLKKTPEETEKIIRVMKAKGIIVVDEENDKIAWKNVNK